MREEVGHMLH